MPPAPSGTEATLPTVVRGGIVSATTGFAAFTLLAVAARFAGWPFSVVFAGALLIWGAVGVAAARCVWRRRAGVSRSEIVPAALLLALAVISGAVACGLNAPEEDDSLYVPPAVQALAHPDRPMTLDYTWIVPFSNGVRPGFSLGTIFNNVELLWACVSRLTGVDLLTLYQAGGAFVFGAAFVLVYFWLLAQSSRSTPAALGGTLVVVLAAFLLFREGGLGFGSILNKIWIGKAIVMAIMIPLVAGFAIEFTAAPGLKRWSLLALSTIAATGLSASALFLIPAVLVALMPGALLPARPRAGSARWSRVWTAAALPAAAAYPLLVGGMFYFAYKARISTIHEVTFASGMEAFRSGFVPHFGTPHSLTFMTVLASTLYLLVRRHPFHLIVLCWFAAAAALFANPITASFVASHVTSTLAYNRIFYVLPVFALTGTAASDLLSRVPARWQVLIAISLVEAAAAYVVHVSPGNLQLDVEKFRVLGAPHVGRPLVRIDAGLMADVREIERSVPDGNTLSAVDYELAISMMTPRLPQYGLWPIDVITMFGETQGAPEEGQRRYGAARFLIGQEGFRGDFEAMLATPVRNVILSNRLGNDLAAMKQAAASHGFALVRETTRYVLYTRGSDRRP